ncbi:MAG: LysR family transcriptional regulator [Anaerolineae bacterium]
MLDAHQLNVFLVASETLNFTLAARRLHMSQPSVSQHIQSLEQHFGQPLFIRAGRTIQLTDAGEALVPLAQDMVNRSIRIEETIKSLQGQVYGHLLVGCSTTPGKYILPQLLARFHDKFPNVKISCHVAPQEQALRTLEEGEVHFALASVPHTSFKQIEFSKFMTDQILLIVPLDHPWAAKGVIELQELYETNFIFREEDSGTQVTVETTLTEAGIAVDELETLLILGNAEAIALAVKEGLGAGFVSSLVVSRLVNGQVATIQIKGVELARDIYIGRLTNRLATKAQTAFWDFAINQREAVVRELNAEQAAIV